MEAQARLHFQLHFRSPLCGCPVPAGIPARPLAAARGFETKLELDFTAVHTAATYQVVAKRAATSSQFVFASSLTTSAADGDITTLTYTPANTNSKLERGAWTFEVRATNENGAQGEAGPTLPVKFGTPVAPAITSVVGGIGKVTLPVRKIGAA